MGKQLVIFLVAILALIYFFTDYGKQIDTFLESFHKPVVKTATETASPRGKIIERDPEDFFPLSEGRTWRYTTTHATKGKGKLSITNLSPRNINGKKTFPRQYNFDNGGVFLSYIIYISKENSDIYQFAKGSTLDAQPQMYEPIDLIKGPIQLGANWQRTNTTGLIEGIDEVITVPAGTFRNCLKIKTTFASGAQTIQWLAPEIGVVRLQYIYSNSRRNSEFLLEAYK